MIRLNDPNVSISSFHSTINYHLDKMAHLKKVNLKEYRLMLFKPWITNEILNKCKKRYKLFKAISDEKDQNKAPDLQQQYNEFTRDKRKSR